MKDKKKSTIIYFGGHQEIAESLAQTGDYLVNTVSPSNINHIVETVIHDKKMVSVAKDSLEDDARAIIIDMNFFEGVDIAKSRIEQIIKAKLKGQHENEEPQYPIDNLTKWVETVLNELPQSIESVVADNKDEANIDQIVNNIFEKHGPDYIKAVMHKVPTVLILGEEKYRCLVNYIDKMQKSADKRIKDSRDTGYKRDQLEREDDARWKPLVLLTSNKKLEDKTKVQDINKGYLVMDLIKSLMKENNLDINISNVINTRVEIDGKAKVDTSRILQTLDWTEMNYDIEMMGEKKDIKDYAKYAVSVFRALDVEGSIEDHSLRTALLMRKLLKAASKSDINPRYKIPREDWKATILGAALHDNGKLLNLTNIPLPNFLAEMQTNSERLPKDGQGDLVRRSHTELGGENLKAILENSTIKGNKKILKYVSEMAYYHHEYYIDVDGKQGYSRVPEKDGEKEYSEGPKHDDSKIMPLSAQYMAIVDVFDAIISGRNYNPKGVPLETAIGIMAKEGGIKIIQENEDNKPVVANEKNWCMTADTRFEFEEGYMSKNLLHFNPVLLKCFFEFLQEENMKFKAGEKTFIKFAPETEQIFRNNERGEVLVEERIKYRTKGHRSYILGIGEKNFDKGVHKKRENLTINTLRRATGLSR